MTPMQFKYEYFVKVLSVDLDAHTALIKPFPTRKQIEDGIYFDTKEYTVPISDRCIYEGIKANDTVCIRKFLDDTFLAVYVSESDKSGEPTEEQLKAYEDLIGGY